MYLLTVCHTIVACALSPIEMNRIQWVLYNAHPCFGIIRASILLFGFFLRFASRVVRKLYDFNH